MTLPISLKNEAKAAEEVFDKRQHLLNEDFDVFNLHDIIHETANLANEKLFTRLTKAPEGFREFRLCAMEGHAGYIVSGLYTEYHKKGEDIPVVESAAIASLRARCKTQCSFNEELLIKNANLNQRISELTSALEKINLKLTSAQHLTKEEYEVCDIARKTLGSAE